MYCEHLDESRNHLIDKIDEIYHRNETIVEERTLSIRTLLHPTHSCLTTRKMVQRATMDYINNIPISF